MSEALNDDHIIRDIDPDTERDGRLVPRGFWRTGSGTDKRDTYEHGGSFDCYGMWPATGDDPDRTAASIANVHPAWWQTTKAKDKDGARPARDLALAADDRFMLLDEVSPGEARRLPLTPDVAAPKASAPEGDKELKTPRVSSITGRPIPLGSPGVVIPGLEETAQAALFVPAWDGVLMAPHLGEDHADKAFGYATRVVDLDDVKKGGTGRAYGDDVIAGLHSVWRVQRLPGKTAPGPDLGTRGQVCWNLAGAGDGSGPGYGAYHAVGDTGGLTGEDAFTDTTSVVRPDVPPGLTRINAFTSHEMGGPFHPGHEADAHSCGGTGAQGDAPWNAGHLSLRTLFYSSPSFDAPLEFQERFEPDTLPGVGIPTRVNLTMDSRGKHTWAGGTAPGLWRWHVLQALDTDDPEEIEDLIPGGKPGTPGGGTVSRSVADWQPLGGAVRNAGVLSWPRDLTVPALTFRAVPFGTRDVDTRYARGTWTPEMLAEWRNRPIVARLEAYAVEPTTLTGDADPRYASARVAAGSVALLPGNVGMEDADLYWARPGRTVSKAFLVLPGDAAKLGFATPDRATGGIKSGFALYQKAATNATLHLDWHDSAGARTLIGFWTDDGTYDTVTGGLTSAGAVNFGSASSLTLPAVVSGSNLPTADPGVVGRLWNNGGIVQVSS